MACKRVGKKVRMKCGLDRLFLLKYGGVSYFE